MTTTPLMKEFIGACMLAMMTTVWASAQIVNPVHWSFAQKHVKDNVYELTFTANIDKGYHTFPTKLPATATPLPTSFTFDKLTGCELDGAMTESGEVHSMRDFPDTMSILKTYEKQAVFKQKIKLTADMGTVHGVLTYMKCDAHACLPPEDVEFNFTINKDLPRNGAARDTAHGMIAPPQPNNSSSSNASNAGTASAPADAPKTAAQIHSSKPANNVRDANDIKDKSLWRIFLIGFGAGALSLITPCVYSMIPLTVTFFTKRSGNRKRGVAQAMFYAFSIVVIFVLIGVVLYLFNVSGDSVNEFASNGVFNFILFVLFVVFAVSFFGVFEITLPSSWVNKSETMSDKGGLLGIFFMAFTLVLVSFSCTAPFVGSALALITQGHAAGPIVGMFAYSLAFALPFGLFAFFPNWLQSLPKSGGWLNVVKVTFAFVELALALKFLSNVDLAYHWRFLDREIFLALWIIIFSLLGLYLLGFIRFSHDTPVAHLSITRLCLAILSLAFSLYMLPGLWGAPLKAISAFAPPQATQDFNLGLGGSSTQIKSSNAPHKYSDILHSPNGLDGYFDYDEALAAAKRGGKPLMIDFTGHSCVNCRKMEASVWSNPEVLRRMQNDYVLVSLYVDDRTDLPEPEQYTSTFSNKKIKTLGNRNSDLQASRYNTNSQPYYVLVDHDEQMLTPPRGYNEDIADYIGFLDAGLKEFKQRQGK